MPDHHTNGEHDGEKLDSNSMASRTRRFFAHVRLFQVRDLMWRVMDAWEEQKRFRMITIGVVLAGVTLGATWIWIHPWWTERTAISVTRQWIATGRLDRASEAVKKALAIAPENPVVWQMAADLARLGGNKSVALSYAHYAAEVSKWDARYVLAWASAAIQDNKLEDADKAMALLPPDFLTSSSVGRRIAGELARRKGQLSLAQENFEAALKLDGPVAIDEVPLGMVLLNSTHTEIRARGLSLLEKWADQSELGASAMRTLLADALVRNNTPSMLKWGLALKRHPYCNYGDIPNCLTALSRSDDVKFQEILAEMEKAHALQPDQAALLIGWLNQIGKGAEALRWAHTLPPTYSRMPVVAIAMAESLRQIKDWSELLQLMTAVEFDGNLQFMGWAYSMVAAHQLGLTEREGELWSTLKAHGQSNGAHSMFAASALYTWGFADEAVVLYKIASEVPGVEMQALGALVRHYQVKRDAIGQFEAYRKLSRLRAYDAAIGNNYAFLAALTGKDLPGAERISKDNFEHHPENVIYRSTYAFVLAVQGSHAEAHKLIRSVSQDWKKSPAIAFAYGYILAKTGDRAEARKVIATLNSNNVSRHEAELLADALK